MKNVHFFLCMTLVVGAFALPAVAAQMQISGDTQVMLEAMRKVMHHDFRGAEALYGNAIAINPNNMDAWLQRALMRRELGDGAGAMSDGRQVVTLCNQGLAGNPNDANLYYHRGMGYRLLKDYPDAERDIAKAISMGGQAGWKDDLQATELEAKEGR